MSHMDFRKDCGKILTHFRRCGCGNFYTGVGYSQIPQIIDVLVLCSSSTYLPSIVLRSAGCRITRCHQFHLCKANRRACCPGACLPRHQAKFPSMRRRHPPPRLTPRIDPGPCRRGRRLVAVRTSSDRSDTTSTSPPASAWCKFS